MVEKSNFLVRQAIIGIIAFSNFYGSCQLVVSRESLKFNDGYYYYNFDLFTGKVYDYYSNGSLKSMHNLVKGIYEGKVELYFEKLAFKKSDYIDSTLIKESSNKLQLVNTQILEANNQAKDLALRKSNFINLKFKNIEKFQKLLNKGLIGKLKGEKLLLYNEFKAIERQISLNKDLMRDYSLEVIRIEDLIRTEESKPHYSPKVSHEYYYNKGEQTGPSKSYYPSGDIILSQNYINGVLDGEWISYFRGSKIMEKKQYSLGKLQGESISYYETGGIKEKKYFSNDILEGDYLSNYANGTKKEVGTFLSGQMNGVWKYFFENGEIQQVITYEKGIKNGPYKSYYENGQLQTEVFYKNGLENGLYKSYFDNGQLERKGTKNSSSLHFWKFVGDVVEYNEDGKLIKHFNAKMDGQMVNLITGSTTKINPNSSHKCQWCSRNFKGAGWIAFEKSIIVKEGLWFPDNPEYEQWFCSKKCASEDSFR
jgi:antitoxin component YwqK of YwqJK toxin-antitoxin module